MRDIDVRRALHAKVLAEHHDQADTLVVDELGLCYGTARVDVAVVNGRLHGFEIKSERDTLERLPGQVAMYGRVLDRVTLVVSTSHLESAAAMIPAWWGIKRVTRGARGAVHFEEHRAPRSNPSVEPLALAAMLWRDELCEELDARSWARGYRSKPREVLARRLAGLLPLTDLRSVVRARLKSRNGWRAGAPRTLSGDSFRPA